MDPVTALGVASAAVQFVQVGLKVAKTLTEYINASPGDVPKALTDITIQLPLLTKSLSTIEDEAKVLKLDNETRLILQGVVLGCLKLTRELDHIATKLSPKPGESLSKKLKKVLETLKSENRISEIERGLGAYIQILILHQVVNPAEAQVTGADVTYYEVKEIRVAKAIPRPALVAKIHKAFRQASRSEQSTPEFVILTGKEGRGKTQLALEYCNDARDHFRAIFWLDASSPKSLERGLESVSATIRRTKAGTTKEKLDFLQTFLADIWHSWMFVLDNYEHKAFDATPLSGFFPATGHGAILVITRTTKAIPELVEIRVHEALTEDDFTNWRYEVSSAVRQKQLDLIVDALDEGFDPNCLSANVWSNEGSPMIQLAAESGFTEAVRIFLERGANPQLNKHRGSTLSAACASGSLPTIKAYLDHEARTGYRMEDGNYAEAVARAVVNNQLDALSLLLKERGERVDRNGEKLARGYEGDHCLGKAAQAGYRECVELMVEYQKFPESTAQGASILGKAVQFGQLDMVKYLLNVIHCDPNGFNLQYGYTPLVTAVGNEPGLRAADTRNAIIIALLEAGASINRLDRHSHLSPLHRAVYNGLESTTQLLLEHGADPSLTRDDGLNPLEYCVDSGNSKINLMLASVKLPDPEAHRRYYSRILFRVCRDGYRELAVPILKEADINTIDQATGQTPLIAAISRAQLPMARMLVRKGARQDIKDQSGKTPLRLAVENDMHLLIQDLAKAKDAPSLDEADDQGFTPLMTAVKAGHLQAAGTLLRLGADRDAMNEFGEIALDIAEESGNAKMIALLQAEPGFEVV